jgi:hypothetical protein
MLKFLDRHAIRILSALGAVFALVGLVIGLRTGAKRGECEALAGGAVVTGLIAVLPRKNHSFRRRRSTPYVSPYVVQFDDEGVTVNLRNKRHEAVQWGDLVMVAITIRDCFLPGPFWILAGSPGKGGCVYPNDAVGAKSMLCELQRRLPDFDNRALIQAMGMMAGGVIVWERPDGKAHGAEKLT